MSHREWLDTPWWVRQVYVEGMLQEELIKGGESDEWELDPTGASMEEFRESGFTVIDGG
jgi:hypothetical protein